MGIKITDCNFYGPIQIGLGPNKINQPPIDLSNLPDDVDIEIHGEKFTKPSHLSLSVLIKITDMKNPVRLGPCPSCGLFRTYTDDILDQHTDGDVVYCIMES